MAELPIIADVFRCAFNWVANGQRAVNVLHVRSTTLTPAQIATELDSEVTAGMFDTVSTQGSATSVDITPLDGITATSNHALTNWTGDNAGDFVPQVSGLMVLRTGSRGSAHRGRIFLPFGAEGVMDDGAWSSAVITEQNAQWAQYLTDTDAGGATIGVASYKNATFLSADTATLQPVPCTQNRRARRLRSTG